MSRTHKISNFDQAEEYINSIMGRLSGMEGRIVSESANIRKEFNKTINQRITDLNQATIKREEKIVNDLATYTDSRMAQMEIQHRNAIIKQAKNFTKVVEKQGVEFTEKLMQQSASLTGLIEHNTDILRMEMNDQKNYLNKKIDGVRNETINIINNLTQEVSKNFEIHRKEIETIKTDVGEIRQDLKGVWKEIETMIRKEHTQIDEATFNIESCQAIWNCLESDSAVRKFEKEGSQRLKSKLIDLKNSSLTSPQSVNALAQNLRYDMLELQENAQKKQTVFNFLYAAALSNAEALLEVMHHNREKSYFTNNKGEPILDASGNPIKVEIDYWTEGEYSRIEQEVRDIRQELIDHKDASELTKEKTEELLAGIKDLETRQNSLVTTAAYRGILSEERLLLSEHIINALQKNNFELKVGENGEYQHNYLGNLDKGRETDPREGVYAVLKNADGVEITVIVNPDESFQTNQVVYHRNDENTDNPDELLRTIEFIHNSIGSDQYKMSAPKPPAETGDVQIPGLADANALQKIGFKGIVKKGSH